MVVKSHLQSGRYPTLRGVLFTNKLSNKINVQLKHGKPLLYWHVQKIIITKSKLPRIMNGSQPRGWLTGLQGKGWETLIWMDFHCEKSLSGTLCMLGTSGAIYLVSKEATIWDVAQEKKPNKSLNFMKEKFSCLNVTSIVFAQLVLNCFSLEVLITPIKKI